MISVDPSNFIEVFEKWLAAFAPEDVRRREWADRFVMDLRCQYQFDRQNGVLRYKQEKWHAPVSEYESFWRKHQRPPAKAVDEYIATNKDLLYDQIDQNNHGDFYTPLALAKIAQKAISKHLSEGPRRTWWDPAAGGGNLFFRFTEPSHIILSSKFKNDCDGLRGNPSVRANQVFQIDFIHDMIEKDLLWKKQWDQIKTIVDKSDELVFFMNPPFDDQADSKGTNLKLPQMFLDNGDTGKISPRSMRALHTRFFYRILCLAETLQKPVWVAAFSKTAWVVGPDSKTFFQRWTRSFEFKDGFLISSKVFNGTKQEWPCLFSIWHFDPRKTPSVTTSTSPLLVDVYDSKYTRIGQKALLPFNENSVRLSEIAKIAPSVRGHRDSDVLVPPLDNEFEICEKPYEDTLPSAALGYLRIVANDVYNSQKRVQFFSSIFGPSNHNGVPVLKENFAQCLAVYGIRKSVRRTWLNDKDEFYLPVEMTPQHTSLLRQAAIFALVDGGYASSLEGLKYKKQTFELTNQFFLLTRRELKKLNADFIPDKNPYAVEWLQGLESDLSFLERRAIETAKNLLIESFHSGLRSKGDPDRQLYRGDAGIRQLINGLLNYTDSLNPSLRHAYNAYLMAKEELRAEIEKCAYSLGVLQPFVQEHVPSLNPRDESLRHEGRHSQLDLAL